jgi:hypothetical protein
MKPHPYPTNRYIGRLIISMLLALGLAPALASWQESKPQTDSVLIPYTDNDAYIIYAALLQSAKGSSFVIRSETESRPSATSENVGISGDRDFYKIWGQVLKDYASQYRSPKTLTRSIPMKVSYELITKQNLESILKSKGSWRTFYDLYPQSNGYFWFSAVGFDSQKTHAIVSMGHSCGPLCGNGQPYFFEKKNGTWQKVSVHAQIRRSGVSPLETAPRLGTASGWHRRSSRPKQLTAAHTGTLHERAGVGILEILRSDDRRCY